MGYRYILSVVFFLLWSQYLPVFHFSLTSTWLKTKSDTCRPYKITITIDIVQFILLVTIRRVSFFFYPQARTYNIRSKTVKFLYLLGFFFSSRSLTFTNQNKINGLCTRDELITVQSIIALRLIPRCCCFFSVYIDINRKKKKGNVPDHFFYIICSSYLFLRFSVFWIPFVLEII